MRGSILRFDVDIYYEVAAKFLFKPLLDICRNLMAFSYGDVRPDMYIDIDDDGMTVFP